MATVACPACGAAFGAGEIEQSVVGSLYSVPSCQSCFVTWPAAFLAEALPKETLSRLRAARRAMALQLAEAAVPATLPALPLWRSNKALYVERESLVQEQWRQMGLRDETRRLRQAARLEQSRVAAAMHAAAGSDAAGVAASDGASASTRAGDGVCARVGCGGVLVNGQCVACFSRACAECGEVAGDAHVCDLSVVLSRRVIAQATRPCPRCAAPISRTEGCHQMFCTRCSTKFWWSTGAIIGDSVFFDNPHFYSARQAASHNDDKSRRCWFATLERARNRVGSARVARVLFCLVVRQAMHLAELLGPAGAPAWRSPFYFSDGRDRATYMFPFTASTTERGAFSCWSNADLQYGDQPGAVSCRGKLRARDSLARERERFAGGQLTEELFKRRLERLERRSAEFADVTAVLASHVAGVAEAVAAWFAVDERVYTNAHDTEEAHSHNEISDDKVAALAAESAAKAAKADGEMLHAMRAIVERTGMALAALLRFKDCGDYILDAVHPIRGCFDSQTCERHRFTPKRWLARLRQMRDQIGATLSVVDLAAEPRGHAALIRFDVVYERALSRKSVRVGVRATPGAATVGAVAATTALGLLGTALRLPPEATEHRCTCAHCDLARTFDLMRRGACTEDREDLDRAEAEEHARLESHKLPWACYDKERDLAAAAHRELFP